MQSQVRDDPRGLDYTEISLGADKAGVLVRQILNRKLSGENRSLI